MKKGGLIAPWVLISVLGMFFLAFLIYDVARASYTGEIDEMLFIARDLAMQINTLNAITGDAYISNDNMEKYLINFNDGNVELFRFMGDTNKVSYTYVDSNSVISYKFNKPNRLFLSKNDGKIEVSETLPIFTKND